MTIQELIDKLSKHDPSLHVYIPGYEGGVNDVRSFEEVEVFLNVNEDWWYGPHEINDRLILKDTSELKTQKGIFLQK
jgi:hypothetical protein